MLGWMPNHDEDLAIRHWRTGAIRDERRGRTR
jgi:hypothetical protein